MRDFQKFLDQRLEPSLREFLLKLALLAEGRGHKIYLVGGFVRDLFLGRESFDLDFMTLVDCRDFVKFLHRTWAEHFPDSPELSKPISFKKYLTAKLAFRAEAFLGLDVLDFSSARKECYASSGAAPVVSPGTLFEDLARRDFSVNALAIDLDPSVGFSLLDYFSGLDDLAAKKLRVLHERSFYEDPARLIRALRLIARLDFELEPKTRVLFEEAVAEKYLANLPPFRLKDEFAKAFSELDQQRLIETLGAYGLLSQYLELACR